MARSGCIKMSLYNFKKIHLYLKAVNDPKVELVMKAFHLFKIMSLVVKKPETEAKYLVQTQGSHSTGFKQLCRVYFQIQCRSLMESSL